MGLYKEAKGVVFGFSIGFTTGILVRDLIPGMRKMVKPIAKNLLRGAFTLVEKCREGLAVFGETVEDLAAEVNSELKAEQEAHLNSKTAKKKGMRKKGPAKPAKTSSSERATYAA